MIQGREMIQARVSEPADVDWDSTGTSAILHFLTDDARSIVLAMPAELLEILRADILRAIRSKSAANPDR